MLRIQSLTIDCSDPRALAAFWAEALSWAVTYESDEEVVLEVPEGNEWGSAVSYLLFIRVPDEKVTKNRFHLDLRPADQSAEVTRLEGLGATRVEIGQAAEEGITWVVMADPAGNEFCVLRAAKPQAEA